MAARSLASRELDAAGALARPRLVELFELVFGGAVGGLLSDWRWQPTMSAIAKAAAVRYRILFFMVC